MPGAGPREPLGGRLREAWLSGTLQVRSRGWRKNLKRGELKDLGSVAEREFNLDLGV